MDIFGIMAWADQNNCTGSELIDKIKNNMSKKEIADSLLFLTMKLSENPLIAMIDPTFTFTLTSLILVVTENDTDMLSEATNQINERKKNV